MATTEVPPQQLLPGEEEALQELRAELATSPADLPGRQWLLHDAGDLTLVRFLRGHKLKVKKAAKLLRACAKWREEYGTNDIRETWPRARSKGALLMQRHWPMGDAGADLEGRPVHFFHMSMADFPGLVKHAGVAAMVRHNVFLMETALHNNPRGEAVMVVDLGSDSSAAAAFSLKNVTRWLQSAIVFVKAMAKIADPYYPESYCRIYFTRVHTVFEKMYKTMSSTMNEGTLSKVQVLRGADTLDKLLEDIPRESVPEALGGDGAPNSVRGGLLTAEEVAQAEADAVENGEEDGDEEGDGDGAADEDEAGAPNAAAKPRSSLRKSLAKRLSLGKK